MKKYVIVSKSELDDPESTIDFSQLSYSSKSALRYSLDGESAVIQYETPIPSFQHLARPLTPILKSLEILDGEDWTEHYTQEEVESCDRK